MLNDFGNIPSENDLRDLARFDCREIEPGLTSEEITEQQVARDSAGDETGEPYDGAGWPGDGSGTDDLADYNQNEADDYSGE